MQCCSIKLLLFNRWTPHQVRKENSTHLNGGSQPLARRTIPSSSYKIKTFGSKDTCLPSRTPKRHCSTSENLSGKTIRLNWFSVWVLLLTPPYLELQHSSQGYLNSKWKRFRTFFWLYPNLPVTLPHQDATGTKVCTDGSLYFESVEFYHGHLGNVSCFSSEWEGNAAVPLSAGNYSDLLWAIRRCQKSQPHNVSYLLDIPVRSSLGQVVNSLMFSTGEKKKRNQTC